MRGGCDNTILTGLKFQDTSRYITYRTRANAFNNLDLGERKRESAGEREGEGGRQRNNMGVREREREREDQTGMGRWRGMWRK